MATKIQAKDVVAYFRTADLEAVELVLELGQSAFRERSEVRAKMSENLKKARASRKPKGANGAEASPAVPSVPAPAHTAAATSAESDSEIEA